MISLKRYLDSDQVREPWREDWIRTAAILGSPFCISGTSRGHWRMRRERLPRSRAELKSSLTRIDEELAHHSDVPGIHAPGVSSTICCMDWGKKTALHYLDKAGEVKDLLLVMARTAESLGHKDDRYTRSNSIP